MAEGVGEGSGGGSMAGAGPVPAAAAGAEVQGVGKGAAAVAAASIHVRGLDLFNFYSIELLVNRKIQSCDVASNIDSEHFNNSNIQTCLKCHWFKRTQIPSFKHFERINYQ